MNKKTVARQQITIADVRDGEKGAKGDTGARGANGSNGAAAEFYRLQPRTEKAIVASDNVLRVNLEYTIEHVKGAQISVETGAAQGYHLIAWTNQGVFLTMTAGRVNSGTYQMANYSKAQNRPDFINIELRNKANKTLDRRTVQITMEAASFVNVIGDVRETVSQHGRNISKIEQKADGISLKVEGMKNGVRNLLKGGRLNVTSSQYGIPLSPLKVKLKPETDYTLTVNGHISTRAAELVQVLRTFVFNSNWSWASSCVIKDTTDATVSVTFRIPAGNATTDGIYQVHSYPYPNQEQGKNGEVTVNWVVVTEGTQAAASWIPAEGETGEEKAREVEARLENGKFRVKSDETVFIDNNGKETVLIKNGKVNADLIEAKEIVTEGLKAGNIDAENATIKNLVVDGNSQFKGELDGASGSFTQLNCVGTDSRVVASLRFSPEGRMVFDGDISSQGVKDVNGRNRALIYYASDIWCRGQFGHHSRTCVVVKDDMMYVHHSGHEYTDGLKIILERVTTRTGKEVYAIPLYSPGVAGSWGNNGEVVDYDNPKINELYSDPYKRADAEQLELPAGAPIDVVVFNCTRWCLYRFVGMDNGKQWTVINGNDRTSATICCHGGTFDVHGGYVLDCHYVNPDWLSPSTVDRTSFGAGVMVGRELDMNW